MEFTINLPDTMEVSMRSGVSVTVPVATYAPEIIARAAMMGLGQKVRNFAASARINAATIIAGPKRNDESEEAYDKRLEKITVPTDALNAQALSLMTEGLAQLAAGEWGAERTASGGHGVDPDVLREFAAIRKAAGKPFAFEKGTSPAKREAIIAEAFLALDDAKRAAITKRVESARAERSALADMV